MRQIHRAAERDPWAPVGHQVQMARQAYCDGLWVVLWSPTAKGGKYWAARHDAGRDLRAYGQSVYVGNVRACSQSFDDALEVVEGKVGKRYRFIGSFDELPSLGPGYPPDWLWRDLPATDTAAPQSGADSATPQSTAQPVAACPIAWPGRDVEHAWIW